MIEVDLAPSLFVYFSVMGLGEFYVFAAVFSFLLLLQAVILMIAYQKNLYKLIIIMRICIVIFTVGAFFNLFIDTMVFNEQYPQYIKDLANYGPYNSTEATAMALNATNSSQAT